MSSLEVVVFDVNETLSDMAPMAARFEQVGAPGSLATSWFGAVLRDGFALTAAGASQPFATVATETLRTLLAGIPLDDGLDAAVNHVMTGFSELRLHPDVADGVRALRAAGLRLVTLTNGATAVAERLLGAAGLRDQFEQLLSVEAAGAWKPAARAYAHAARMCGVGEERMLLVAVHPWDVDGAARAGLRTAWVNRDRRMYPSFFTPPDHVVSALTELAGRLR